MDLTIILLLSSVVLILLISFFFLRKINKYKNEISNFKKAVIKYEVNLKTIEEDLNIRKFKSNITHEISFALNAAQKGPIEFEEAMSNLAKSIRLEFKSEYCGIGKLLKTDQLYFEDYAISYVEKENKGEIEEQKLYSKQVKHASFNDPSYFISEAFKKEEQVVFFNENRIKLKENKNKKIYIEKILKSGRLLNIVVIKIRNKNGKDFIGYIQLINSTQNDLKRIIDFTESFSQLINFAIISDIKKIELEKKSKIVADASFITNLILNGKDNVDSILDQVIEYILNEFNIAVISFRIPILHGINKKIYFCLRKCKVNKSIPKFEELENYYYSKKCTIEENLMGGIQNLKCYNTKDLIYCNIIDDSYYSLFFNEKLINTKKSLIIPILREINPPNCYETKFKINGKEKCYKCLEKFDNLYGIFKLRLFEELSDFEFVNERLKRLSMQITFILNSIIDKKEQIINNNIQSNLKTIDFNKIDEFDQQCVIAIKSITQSKECSFYRYKTDQIIVDNRYVEDEILYLSASTCHSIIYEDEICNISDKKSKLFYYLNDPQNIIVNVYKEKKSHYLFNRSLEYNNFFFSEVIEDYINSNLEINELKENLSKESLYFSPVIKRDGSCVGVIELIGKVKNKLDLSEFYWENDKKYNELVIDVIAKLAEAHEAQVSKGKFLSELGHELFSPISEIIHNNDFVIEKAENDIRETSKEILVSALKDNLNSSFFFKQIMEGIEFNYLTLKDKVECNIKIVENPQKIILKAVQTFEKSALFDKQLTIKTNIAHMPSMRFDRNRMMQVFFNLIRNAISYSFNGTKIEIYYKEAVIESPNNKTNKWHEIKFVNSGIGFLQEDLHRVFELYKRGGNVMTMRPSGTGIGLYIVNKIMQAHNGFVEIKKLKNPTEISIFLPF